MNSFGSLHSAPTEASDVAGSSSEPWSQYATCPPTEASGLWNHQTSAPGASLAPGRDCRSSQDHQNEFQQSQSPLDTTAITTPSLGSYDSIQASPMHQRMFQESQPSANPLGNSSFRELHNVNHQLCNVSWRKDFETGYTPQATRCEHEEGESSNFSIDFQQDESKGMLTSSSTAPIAIPQRRNSNSLPPVSVSGAAEYALPTYVNPSQNNESWRKMQSKDRDIEVSMQLLRQQEQTLIAEGVRPKHGMANAWYASPDQDVRHSSHKCISSSSYPATDPSATNQNNIDNMNQGSTAAVRTPQSRECYQPYQASSFPPTAGRFPMHMSAFPDQQNNCSFVSDSGSVASTTSAPSLPMRRRSSKNCAFRRPRSGSLTAVPEYNHLKPKFSPPGAPVPTRGRRRGRLAPATALAAGQKRSDGTVCIRCKMFKQTASKLIFRPSVLLTWG